LEKYKASKNNFEEEIPEKTEEEKTQEATEKAVSMGAEIALDAYTGGQFSQVKDQLGNVPIVGDKVNQAWDGAVKKASKVISKTPTGKMLKKADDMGLTDKAEQAYGMYKQANGGKAPSGSGGAGNTSSKTSSLGGSGSGGSLSGNMMSMGAPGTNPKVLIAIAAFVLLIFMSFVTAIASKDNANLDITNQSQMTSKSKGLRNLTIEEVEDMLVYVGDSRIVGLKSAINKNNINYIAEIGSNFDWLNTTANAELERLLTEKEKRIVVLSHGVNDLYNIDKYINYYNSLISKYPQTYFYIMSINPIDEGLANTNGYNLKTSDIESFNNKLKSNFPNNYLDIYNSLSNIGTNDGLHYDNQTNINIHNLVTSKLSSLIKVGGSVDLLQSLEEVANWYINNVGEYSQSKYVQSPFSTKPVRADCTGFAVAYMSSVAGSDVPDSYSGAMVYTDGVWAKTVEKLGWIAYTSDEIDSLQPGDVLIAHEGSSYSTKGKHAEIYVDESHTFGWGTVKDSYPTNITITKSEYGGHTHYMDSKRDYITIYRYSGADISDLNIIKMNHSSFNHGSKPKQNQKYIMLHDTEMSQNAETVVKSWENSGSGVAAHFVIDRDGTVIQAVDLDVIAHHAGYGGPGNYDSKFNVGNNDGKGNGDDLVGTVPLAGYTSYGMNSYSIGIEMCHVNGEDYPEALLNSLDKVIAYIDTYYGFESKIIDHKSWRPSNSDTDAKFYNYFVNYKNLRHH